MKVAIDLDPGNQNSFQMLHFILPMCNMNEIFFKRVALRRIVASMYQLSLLFNF